MLHRFLIICCCLATLNAVFGHTVWIEPKNDLLVIRFAEPGNDFETSPGHLDSLSTPVSFVVVTNIATVVETFKSSDHFSLKRGSPTNIVCTETVFTVRGGRKPYFYARWQPSAADGGGPLLNLDLVPTGQRGEVRAYFRGEPLAGTKAFLRTPDGKEQELITDQSGYLRFAVKQSGQYLLTIPHYRENAPGIYIGRRYTQTSHNTALTWTQE